MKCIFIAFILFLGCYAPANAQTVTCVSDGSGWMGSATGTDRGYISAYHIVEKCDPTTIKVDGVRQAIIWSDPPKDLLLLTGEGDYTIKCDQYWMVQNDYRVNTKDGIELARNMIHHPLLKSIYDDPWKGKVDADFVRIDADLYPGDSGSGLLHNTEPWVYAILYGGSTIGNRDADGVYTKQEPQNFVSFHDIPYLCGDAK